MINRNTFILIRKFYELRPSELCKLVNMSPSYVSEIESGKKVVNHNMVKKLSESFNMPISTIYLLDEKLNNSSNFNSEEYKMYENILAWHGLLEELKREGVCQKDQN